MSKIIAIDFDGTLFDHRFPDIGPVVPEASDWVKCWLNHGAKIFLWTMRTGVRLEEAKAAVLEHISADGWLGFNENPTQRNWAPDSKKQYAHIYVDDAAFGCPLIRPSDFNRPCVDWGKVGPGVLDLINQ